MVTQKQAQGTRVEAYGATTHYSKSSISNMYHTRRKATPWENQH